ncbi:MAG: hypothetical protein H6631_19805, partial [Anaerolineaceae bacterium]|nr:hypothetical protein [Anaerolineaceae bacterium]
MSSLRDLLNALTPFQAISTNTNLGSSARRRRVSNTLLRLALAVGGALVLLCGLILNLAGIAPSLAAGGLSVEILAGYNLVVDSNVTSPSTAGPSAFTPGARICNTTASPIDDVVVKIGDSAKGTAGIYPQRGPADPGFLTEHPALDDVGGAYAFTHEGGSQGIADATRLVGTLGPGECVVQYWTLSYPRCETVGGVADDPQCQNDAVWGSSVKPEDDLHLNFDVWATGSGNTSGQDSRTMYMRNEISAMANKIQPNGNLGSTWFSTDLDQVKPGSVITTNGILYRIGNVRFGFDNDGDYQPDYNFWMQPIGDASLFDTGCFRLIRTSGVITIAGGTDTSFTFEDQLYFTYPQVPTDNTNVIGEVHYTFLALGDNCAVTPTPYQEAASGYDNEKFNGDYGAGGNAPFNSTPVEVTVNKNSLPDLTGPGTFITYDIFFQNTSTTDSAGLVLTSGDMVINSPLVISDTIPSGMQYQAGSATSSFSSPGLTATVYYSTDNGDSWTTIEPTPALSVTNIQWWLSDSLPPTENGSATFQVFIPLDYSLPVVENCANLQYGNGPSVAESCETTIISGPNSIGDFVWRDEDADGLPDGGEAGIDAITVTLYYDADGNGQLDTSTDIFITNTVTSGSGAYLFESLADGKYLVQVDTDTSNTTLPYGYSLTTDDLIAVDLDSEHNTTAAVDNLDADFGFGPALQVTKSLVDGPAYEGREVTYKIEVENLRPGDGTANASSCTFETWAGTSTTGASNPWVNSNNVFNPDEPDDKYAYSIFTAQPDYIRGSDFNLGSVPGNITKVEAIFPIYLTDIGNDGIMLTDEQLETHFYYNGVLSSSIIFNSTNNNLSTINAFGPDKSKEGLLTWDISAVNSNWQSSDFNGSLLELEVVADKGTGSGNKASIFLNAMGFRITTDETCGGPDNTLNPVPLSDTFDAGLLEFVSADPPQTSVSAGLIEWNNIGPIYAGQTKEITVTFKGLDPGTGQLLTNTATVSNAYFITGNPANDGQDSAVTTISPTGLISGVIWSDGNNNGWQVGNIGYDSNDYFIPGITVTLYGCYNYSTNQFVPTTPAPNKTCEAVSNNNTFWRALATQTTTIDGQYLFEGLLDAYYSVVVNPPSATQQGERNDNLSGGITGGDDMWGTQSAVLNTLSPIQNAGHITNVNFGYSVNPMLYGTIWQDYNADGNINSNEPYLDNGAAGIIVTLSTASGVISTTQTDANGYYEFPDLTAGVLYTITVDTGSLPGGATGWTNTYDPDNGTITPNSQYPLTFTLTAGQISGSHDFGYRGSSSIGDTIFTDWNGDGSQGTGESGISGIDVYLYRDANGDGVLNAGDSLILTDTTDTNGNYLFENLPPGDWIVTVDESNLLKYIQTADRDAIFDGKTAVTTDGTNNIDDVDFGYQPTGTGIVGDYVWYDSNSNGLQGSNESGLPNIEVTLYVDDGDGIFNIATDPVIITTTTDANGKYLFTNLISATYWVDVDTADSDLPTDGFGEPFILTTNNDPLPVVLNSGDTYLNADFGFDGPAVVGNFVWQDNDGDGEQDAGEPGIAGVTVRLFQETSPGVFTLIATDTTDSAGVYLFSGLISDTYRVVVDETTLPTGYSQQTGDPDVGSIGGTSFVCGVDGNAPCDAQSTFQLKTGQIDLTRDFGYLPPRFTGNYVWFDADGDGVQDFTEPGLGGITVTVTLPGGSVFTTTTDIEGYYSFGSDVLGTATGNFTFTIYPGSTYTYTYDYDGGTTTPDSTTVLNIASTN